MALGSGNGLRYDVRTMATKCDVPTCGQGGPGESERTQRCIDKHGLRRVTPHKARVDASRKHANVC